MELRDANPSFDGGYSNHGAFGTCGDWATTSRAWLETWLSANRSYVEEIVYALAQGTDIWDRTRGLVAYLADGELLQRIQLEVVVHEPSHVVLSESMAQRGLTSDVRDANKAAAPLHRSACGLVIR